MNPTTELHGLLLELGYFVPEDERVRGVLGSGTMNALRVFQRLHRLDQTEEPDEATLALLRRAVEIGESVVFGQLVDDVGPVVAAQITVQDRDLGEGPWPTLGEALTDGDGRFTVLYASEAVQPGDRIFGRRLVVADLIFSISEQPVPYHEFTVLRLPELEPATEDDRILGIQARRLEEVRIVLKVRQPRRPLGPSEYERLLTAFREVWPDRSIAELDQEQRREVTFVARELSVDSGQIAALRNATLVSQTAFRNAIPPEIFYGLARSRRRYDSLAALATADEERLTKGLADAIERHIIPWLEPDQVREIARAISEQASRHAIDDPAGAMLHFREVVGESLPTVDEQVELVRGYASSRGSIPAFWAHLRTVPGFEDPAKVVQIQTALQLDALAQGHLPLVRTLQTDVGISTPRDLLDLSPERLTELVARGDVGVPASTPGAGNDEQIANYVGSIVNSVSLAFPTETVATSLREAPASWVGGETAQAGVARFFANTTTDTTRADGAAFDIRHTEIDDFVARHGDIAFHDVAPEARGDVVAQVKRAQRLFRLSSSPHAFTALVESGLDSARSIAAIPRETFLTRFGQKLGAAEAAMVHTRAVATTTAALGTWVMVNDVLTGASPDAVMTTADPATTQNVRDSVAKHLPTWQGLFGPLELCECAHCRSVYSPAAYLVDLLDYLADSGANADGFTPRDVLVGQLTADGGPPGLPGRRPDIARLKLSCENTNTALPYVDLVNEVLESLVPALDPAEIPAFDTGEAPALELQAEPHHTNEAAYSTPVQPGATSRLDRALFPFTLPYDDALAEARVDLDHLGVRLADLRDRLEAPGDLAAAERIGLSPAAYEVLTGQRVDGAAAVLGQTADEFFGLTPNLAPTLRLGDGGRWVAAVRGKLNTIGAGLQLAAGPSADSFDAALESALQDWQTGAGLPSDGTVDEDDWRALSAIDPPVAVSVLPSLREFMTRAAVSYEETRTLLAMRAVNPERPTLDRLGRLTLGPADVDALIASNFASLTPAGSQVLADNGVSEPEFLVWAAAHLGQDAGDRFRRTILLASPAGQETNLDRTTLRHHDDAEPDLHPEEWLRLGRIIRLWRTLGWSLTELDTAMGALGTRDVTPDLIRGLAQIERLRTLLNVSVDQVVALWLPLDPTAPDGLYGRVFLKPAIIKRDPAFVPDWKGDLLPGAKLGDHLPALQAVLNLRAVDLADLRAADPAAAAIDADLTLDVLSGLHRRATLARALRLKPGGLVTLLNLSGLDPFVAPSSGWPAMEFVHSVRTLQDAGLQVAQLDYLLRDNAEPTSLAPVQQVVDTMLATMRDGLRQIEDTYALQPDPLGEGTRTALSLLYADPKTLDDLIRLIDGTAVYAAPLAALPDGITYPSGLANRVTYAAAEKQLRVLGALTVLERDALVALANNGPYQDAVNALHAAPAAVLSRALSEPTDLTPSWPDAEEHVLETSSFDDQGASDPVAVAAKFAFVLEHTLPDLRILLGRVLIKQAISDHLRLIPETAAVLLEGRDGPIVATEDGNAVIASFLGLAASNDLAPARRAQRRLHKAAFLVDTFALSPDDIVNLHGTVVDFNELPVEYIEDADPAAFGQVVELATLTAIRDALQLADGKPFGVLGADDAAAAIASLAELSGWSRGMLESLAGAQGLNLQLADLHTPSTLERLRVAAETVVALGVSATAALNWARSEVDRATATATRTAVRSRYDDTGWLAVAPALSSALRISRRDALVAYLLPRLGLATPDDLYEYLLIDVQMDPCMMTSRVKQAISSVQLFVQRCLLNMEPRVPTGALDAQHWVWMKNYRVWEANRKVFLYPENWIEPELRDDKTPFFRQLESALLQDDVTQETCERALEQYLESLMGVSKLDVVAVCSQVDFEPAEKIKERLHVFGRSVNEPHLYFHREFVVTANNVTYWTPWDRIPADIDGDLFSAASYNRRLYFCWTVTKLKTRQTADDATPPERFWQTQLAWTERRFGSWSPKRLTGEKRAIETSRYPDDNDPPFIRIDARVGGDQLNVLCIAGNGLASGDSGKKFSYAQPHFDLGTTETLPGDITYVYEVVAGAFRMQESTGHFVRVDDASDSSSFELGFTKVIDDRLSVQRLGKKNSGWVTILNAPGPNPDLIGHSLVYGSGERVVYQDDRRAYFATVRGTTPSDDLLRLKLVEPDLMSLTLEPTPEFTPGLIDPGLHMITESFVHHALVAPPSSNSWLTAAPALALAATSMMTLDAPVALAGSGLLYESVYKAGLVDDFAHSAFASDIELAFEVFYHPHTAAFAASLYKGGLKGLMAPATQARKMRAGAEFATQYAPSSAHTDLSTLIEDVDFGIAPKSGVFKVTAFSQYNWELFFHAPIMIATRLSRNQRFEEAMTWFHYVFDPTKGAGKYWNTVPLQTAPNKRIEDLMLALNQGDPDAIAQMEDWKDHPFQPHLIARMRLAAYQKNTVMRYIDNCIAWGDDCFARDTLESINEATQLYVLAAMLLGKRPERLPPRAPEPMSYAELAPTLDAFGQAMVDFENRFPALTSSSMAPADEAVSLLGLSRTFYFCIPQNDKLLGYWDTVADRLFKIRHCMNLAGVVRQLPLFEPPIDPALLVLAAAKGVDFGSVLRDLSAPLPRHRFASVLQRALDVCGDVRSLGSNLLAVLERKNGEELALLRQQHERTMLGLIKSMKEDQAKDAEIEREALELAAAGIRTRIEYHDGLLRGGLVAQENETFSNLDLSNSRQEDAAVIEIVAQSLNVIPTISVGFGGTPPGSTFSASVGGSNLGAAASAIARSYAYLSSSYAYKSNRAAIAGGNARRKAEWEHQKLLATRELATIERQIAGARVREAIAHKDVLNQDRLIEQSEQIDEFMRYRKYTNQELYAWMEGKLAEVYHQAYRLAVDLAKQAERAFQFERGVTTSNYIAFGSWDSLRKGLLAGEQLTLQLRQLERAHMDKAVRELEIVKNVSLMLHDPAALIILRETGSCEVTIDEGAFDGDYPGHYLRRIKNVSITIPAVVGPYSGVNCTLTLLNSVIRRTAEGANYMAESAEDPRFMFDPVPIQSIVTSGGQNDSGLFELNFRDERYLPFEGAGAVSRWRIELDAMNNNFDASTLTDVVLHLRYTALDGGKILRKAATGALAASAANPDVSTVHRMFSLKHEFPDAWYAFRRTVATEQGATCSVELGHDRFPFQFRGRELRIDQIDLFLGRNAPGGMRFEAPANVIALTIPEVDGSPSALPGNIPFLRYPIGVNLAPGGQLSLEISALAFEPRLEDVVFVCHFSAEELP